jgi:hypothetical protein
LVIEYANQGQNFWTLKPRKALTIKNTMPMQALSPSHVVGLITGIGLEG